MFVSPLGPACRIGRTANMAGVIIQINRQNIGMIDR
jgi:hypothetical protein